MTKEPLGIYLLIVCLALSLNSAGQDFSDIQEYNQRLIINPAFTGTTFGKRIYGDIISSRSSEVKSYTKILSADHYIQSKNMGIGVFGGYRSNGADQTFTLWGEGSLSKIKKLNRNFYLVKGFGLGLEQSIRDIGLKIQRKLFYNPLSSNDQLDQGTRVNLKSGLILGDYDWNAGMGVKLSGKIKLAPSDSTVVKDTTGFDLRYRVVAHWMKTFHFRNRGLLSQYYYLQPRLIVDYRSDRTLVYSDVKVQRFRWTVSLGVLHNLSNNKSRAVLSAGYDLKKYTLHYSISGGLSATDKFVLIHGLNIRVLIPDLGGERNQPLRPLIKDI